MYASNFSQGGQGFSRAGFVLFLRSDRVQVCALGGVSRKSVPRRTREYGNTLCSPPTLCGPVACFSYLITPSFRQSFECAHTRTRTQRARADIARQIACQISVRPYLRRCVHAHTPNLAVTNTAHKTLRTTLFFHFTTPLYSCYRHACRHMCSRFFPRALSFYFYSTSTATAAQPQPASAALPLFCSAPLTFLAATAWSIVRSEASSRDRSTLSSIRRRYGQDSAWGRVGQGSEWRGRGGKRTAASKEGRAGEREGTNRTSQRATRSNARETNGMRRKGRERGRPGREGKKK